jgi:hypothetical protein
MILDFKTCKLNVLILFQSLVPFSMWSFKALFKQSNGHHIILDIIFGMIILIRIDKLWTVKIKVTFLFTIWTSVMKLLKVFLKNRIVPDAEKLLLILRELGQGREKLISL